MRKWPGPHGVITDHSPSRQLMLVRRPWFLSWPIRPSTGSVLQLSSDVGSTTSWFDLTFAAVILAACPLFLPPTAIYHCCRRPRDPSGIVPHAPLRWPKPETRQEHVLMQTFQTLHGVSIHYMAPLRPLIGPPPLEWPHNRPPRLIVPSLSLSA